MHIVVDARMAFSSGIGRVIREVVKRLKGQITLIVSEPWCEGIVCKAPIYSIQEQIALPRLIPQCDVFWSPHYNVPLLPIRAKKRVATIHDVYHLVSELSWVKKAYAKNIMRAALKLSHGVTTVSHFSKEEIGKYLYAREIEVIELASELSRGANKEVVRQKYQLPQKFFLYVGNDKPNKNVPRIVAAAKLAREELILVGKDNLFVADEDLPAVYEMATALVFPSLYEGFGLPPLEAMQCSCPAIVSNRASLPEVCGDAALYVDPEDVNAIAAAMKNVQNVRAELVQKGLKRVEQFSWDHTARKYQQYFETIGSLP